MLRTWRKQPDRLSTTAEKLAEGASSRGKISFSFFFFFSVAFRVRVLVARGLVSAGEVPEGEESQRLIFIAMSWGMTGAPDTI